MNIIIRKAGTKDINKIAQLLDRYRIFYEQESNITAAELFLTERFAKNESVCFVAEQGQEMVGFTQLYPVFSSVGLKRAWILNDLFVEETCRGSGAADLLLKAAQEWGAETGSRWLMLQTAVTNKRAQKVYERNGWKKDNDFFTYYFRPAK